SGRHLRRANRGLSCGNSGIPLASSSVFRGKSVSKKLQRVLMICAAGNLAVVAWDLATGGIYFTIFGIVLSSWEVAKPLRYAAVCATVAIWLRDRGAATTSWDQIPRFSTRTACTLAVASIITAGLFGLRAAGGAD